VYIETHLHFDVAEESLVALEALVVLPHDSDLIGDIREGYSQKSIQQFENFAELEHKFEEILEVDFFFLLVDPHELISILKNEFC
jgi:hypothetical protein